jgi:glycosyltransferase involved in cell wall biosynthesis
MSGISIIICTWNRSASLRRTLASLAVAELPLAQHEVIVVDNNSSDDTRALITELQNSWPKGELRYVFEDRQGKQFALNAGIRHARGDILAFTDDDVEVDREWLLVIERVFSTESVAVVGGVTKVIWPCEPPSWYSPEMSSVVAEVDLGSAIIEPPPPGYTPAGTNLIVRREVFSTIGAFSTEHFRHMDYEFGMRALKAGLRVRYEPALVVRTFLPESVVTPTYFRKWFFKQGIAMESWMERSSTEWLGVPRWVLRAWLESAVRWFWHRLRGRSDDAVRAQFEVAKLSGLLSSRIRRLISPEKQAQWARGRSQKQGEQFQ